MKSFSGQTLSDVDLLMTGSMKILQNPYACNLFKAHVIAKNYENTEEQHEKNHGRGLIKSSFGIRIRQN